MYEGCLLIDRDGSVLYKIARAVYELDERETIDDLVNLQNCLNNCGYYTDSEVNNLHKQLCRDITLSTLTVNCRSLPKNFDKQEYTMKSLDFNFDCIGLT